MPKIFNDSVRGYSTNRDDEGSQASKKSESREESEHEDSIANTEDSMPHKDSLCDRTQDQNPPESSGQPEHDAQQDAAAQQEHEQPPSNNETAENRHAEQQQQSDNDPSATGTVC